MQNRLPQIVGVLLIVVAIGLAADLLLRQDRGAEPAASVPQTGDAAFVLAVSWQPAFCETRPDRPECTSQTAERFDADHFALHGLWPEPAGRVYCGVDHTLEQEDRSGNWGAIGAVEIAEATRARLAIAMPGTQSLLERHEWLKHGTCSGLSADRYYLAAMNLLEGLNSSPLRALFAANIGKRLTFRQIREAMNDAFGAGAGDRVAVDCVEDGARSLIAELRLSLRGDVSMAGNLGPLLLAAAQVSGGCGGGEVDRVGLQ